MYYLDNSFVVGGAFLPVFREYFWYDTSYSAGIIYNQL